MFDFYQFLGILKSQEMDTFGPWGKGVTGPSHRPAGDPRLTFAFEDCHRDSGWKVPDDSMQDGYQFRSGNLVLQNLVESFEFECNMLSQLSQYINFK